MPATHRSNFTAATIAAGGLAVIAGGVWFGFLMRRIWAAAAYGPICGHGLAFGPHCPACYGASALIGLGLGMLTLGAIERGAPIKILSA